MRKVTEEEYDSMTLEEKLVYRADAKAEMWEKATKLPRAIFRKKLIKELKFERRSMLDIAKKVKSEGASVLKIFKNEVKESDKELKLLRKAFLKNKAIRKEEYPALEESTISLKKSLLGEITQINKRMDKFQKTVEELKSINVERVADAMLKTRFKF